MADESAAQEDQQAARADEQVAVAAEEPGQAASSDAQGAEPPGPPAESADAEPLSLPDLAEPGAEEPPSSPTIQMLRDVNLHVKIELGRARMLVNDVLSLGPGSIVELDRLAGDPVDVFVNDRLVARGEILVLNDNFCVRISEILEDPTKAGAD